MGQVDGEAEMVTGAISQIGRAAAVECAQLGRNIRMNSVHPGIIDTPIWQKSITHMMETMTREQAAEITAHSGANQMDLDPIRAQQSPMDRTGSPDEVADLIVFPAFYASSSIRGQEHIIGVAMTAR